MLDTKYIEITSMKQLDRARFNAEDRNRKHKLQTGKDISVVPAKGYDFGTYQIEGINDTYIIHFTKVNNVALIGCTCPAPSTCWHMGYTVDKHIEYKKHEAEYKHLWNSNQPVYENCIEAECMDCGKAFIETAKEFMYCEQCSKVHANDRLVFETLHVHKNGVLKQEKKIIKISNTPKKGMLTNVGSRATVNGQI